MEQHLHNANQKNPSSNHPIHSSHTNKQTEENRNILEDAKTMKDEIA